MSFILEALKKSQQARALGQVPRIDTGLLVEEPPQPRQNPWVLLAVILAAIAVAIAVYAALRDPQTPLATAAVGAPGEETLGLEPEPEPEPTPSPDQTRSMPPALSSGQEDRASQQASHLRYGPSHPGAEPPAPPVGDAAAGPAAPAARGSEVPEDLLEDIASFKAAVLREQRTASEPQPAASAQEPSGGQVRQEGLPAEIQSRLPAFLLTAHVYDAEAAKRFVVINSLKYGEGERTREGLEVLEIRPDGVLLSFAGHSFVHRR